MSSGFFSQRSVAEFEREYEVVNMIRIEACLVDGLRGRLTPAGAPGSSHKTRIVTYATLKDYERRWTTPRLYRETRNENLSPF